MMAASRSGIPIETDTDSVRTAKVTCIVIGVLLVGALAIDLVGRLQNTGTHSRLLDKLLFTLGITRRTAAVSRCKDNLRRIDIFKMEWASEEGKTTNDVPTWDDLRSQFTEFSLIWSNGTPICPAGGTYKINRVGEPPTCSIGGEGHSVPRR